MGKLILKAGREKSLKRRHPWVFSGAVAKVQGNPAAGDTVELADFLKLPALGIHLPSRGYVILTKTELIRSWAESTEPRTRTGAHSALPSPCRR